MHLARRRGSSTRWRPCPMGSQAVPLGVAPDYSTLSSPISFRCFTRDRNGASAWPDLCESKMKPAAPSLFPPNTRYFEFARSALLAGYVPESCERAPRYRAAFCLFPRARNTGRRRTETTAAIRRPITPRSEFARTVRGGRANSQFSVVGRKAETTDRARKADRVGRRGLPIEWDK